jgi:hypothetical protein
LQDPEPNWQDVIDLHEQAQRNLELAKAAFDEAISLLDEMETRLTEEKCHLKELKLFLT